MGYHKMRGHVVVSQFEDAGVTVDCFCTLPEAIEHFVLESAAGVSHGQHPVWGSDDHISSLRGLKDKIEKVLSRAEAVRDRSRRMGACRSGRAPCCENAGMKSRLPLPFECPIECVCHTSAAYSRMKKTWRNTPNGV